MQYKKKTMNMTSIKYNTITTALTLSYDFPCLSLLSTPSPPSYACNVWFVLATEECNNEYEPLGAAHISVLTCWFEPEDKGERR